MGERFAVAAEAELNLLVDKAVAEKHEKNQLHTLQSFLTVRCFNNLDKFDTLIKYSSLLWVFRLVRTKFYSVIKNMTKNIWKTKIFSPTHSIVFIIFFQPVQRWKPSKNMFTNEELEFTSKLAHTTVVYFIYHMGSVSFVLTGDQI